MSSDATDDVRNAIAARTHELTAWASRVGDDLSATVVRRAILIAGDDLAAIIAAADAPELRCLAAALAVPGNEATIFGERRRTEKAAAAVVNGAAANWVELDEGYRRAACHAGLYVLPALLAEAEATGATLAAMLRALAVGYEVATRIARAWSFPRKRPHPHALLSATGAAAAIAALRRVGEHEFFAAVTTAITLAGVGPYEHVTGGALIRNMWAAIGAWNGIHSVDWAQIGIGGIDATPYEVFGVCLGGEPAPDAMTSGLGAEWAVIDGYHKLYACCQHTHSAVEATLAIREELLARGAPDAIARVHVETHPRALALDRIDPQNLLAAKFSLPHTVAAAIVYGNATPQAFTGEALSAPAITRLRERTTMSLLQPRGPWPLDRPARVAVYLEDGTVVVGECASAIGGPDRPLSDEQLLAKIDSLTSAAYPRFAGILRSLLADPAAEASTPWREIVDRMCAA